jgi:hypothetical protein
MCTVIKLFDLNIQVNKYNLIFLKFVDNLIMDFNNNNFKYDKYLIKTKTEGILNIFKKNKSVLVFFPNIFQIIDSTF